MKYFSLAALLAVVTAAGVSAQGKNAPATAQDMFFFSKNGPVLLRVQVEIDGKPVHEMYRDYLKKLFTYYDRDGDGFLNSEELKYLPKGNYLNTLFSNGYNFFNPALGLKMADLGKTENDRVSLDDLAAYFEKFQISPLKPMPNYGGYAQKSPASTALFKILDADGDGKLSKQELLNAKNVLKKYDLNDDEMISAQELTGNTNQPYYGNAPVILPAQPAGGFGGYNQAGSPLYLVNPSTQAQMASMILSRYDKNKDFKLDLAESGLDETTFKKLDKDGDGFLTLTETMHWPEVVAPIEVVLRIGKVKGNQPQVAVTTPAAKLPKGVQVGKAAPGLAYLMLDEAKLSFHGVATSPQMMMNKFAGPGGYYLSLFNAAKKDNNFVEKKDLVGAQYQILANSFEMLNRKGDGKLTEAELENYIALLDGAKYAFASFKISEEGQDLFQILDVNKDGKLSQRELMNAWEVLSTLDRNKDGFITPDEFSQQFVLSVGQGQMLNYNTQFVIANNPGMAPLQPGPAKNAKVGPLWFQKMDVNGDGDVSPREFLGSKELFQKMDLNGDGLIDAEEAWKADEWFNKKNK